MKPLGTYSIAGAQPKVVGDFVGVTGVVAHIRSDHPTQLVNVTLHVTTDDHRGTMCPKCGVPHVTVDARHVTGLG